MGSTATLTCSSDLDAVSVEWLHNGEVLVNSTSQEAQLFFDPVNDNVHGQEYSCRVNSRYGILEDYTTATVYGELYFQISSENIVTMLYNTLLMFSAIFCFEGVSELTSCAHSWSGI